MRQSCALGHVFWGILPIILESSLFKISRGIKGRSDSSPPPISFSHNQLSLTLYIDFAIITTTGTCQITFPMDPSRDFFPHFFKLCWDCQEAFPDQSLTVGLAEVFLSSQVLYYKKSEGSKSPFGLNILVWGLNVSTKSWNIYQWGKCLVQGVIGIFESGLSVLYTVSSCNCINCEYY